MLLLLLVVIMQVHGDGGRRSCAACAAFHLLVCHTVREHQHRWIAAAEAVVAVDAAQPQPRVARCPQAHHLRHHHVPAVGCSVARACDSVSVTGQTCQSQVRHAVVARGGVSVPEPYANDQHMLNVLHFLIEECALAVHAAASLRLEATHAPATAVGVINTPG